MKAYKKSSQLYRKAINAFYKYLKESYSNSNVYFNYMLEDCDEKADIIVISKKTNDMCAFNFIFPYIQNKLIKERTKEYQNKNIKVFWFYGNFELRYKTFYEKDNITRGDNVFDLIYEERKWTIGEQSDGFRTERFFLENLKIAYKPNSRELTLKNGAENNVLNKDIFKKIKWTKFSGIWSGMIYKCPRSTLEEHDLRLENIETCEKCKYFNGYVYERGKKTSIKCRGGVRK